jgi:ABC-type glycerol-3-phosphate transport system permease component
MARVSRGVTLIRPGRQKIRHVTLPHLRGVLFLTLILQLIATAQLFTEPLVLATLFVPAIVLLVPLYLTIVDVPLVHITMIDTFWAVWLPAGASAFNVVIMKRFFDSLRREIFEAAQVDGAGPFRLFWSIVLAMSRPIIGVVSVFAVIGTWKDYLWPLLVVAESEHAAAVRAALDPAAYDSA